MELTLPRRVVAALAAAGLAFGVLAGVTGVGHLAARFAVAGIYGEGPIHIEGLDRVDARISIRVGASSIRCNGRASRLRPADYPP